MWKETSVQSPVTFPQALLTNADNFGIQYLTIRKLCLSGFSSHSFMRNPDSSHYPGEGHGWPTLLYILLFTFQAFSISSYPERLSKGVTVEKA